MKVRILKGINAILALLLGLLGVNTGCGRAKYGIPEPVCEYGVPHATIEVSGKVTDTEAQPVKDIKITIKDKWREEPYIPVGYTDEDGNYRTDPYQIFPTDSVDVFATDTTGVYASDSVRVKVDYDRSQVAKDDHWDEGAGSVIQDFQLKKKQ